MSLSDKILTRMGVLRTEDVKDFIKALKEEITPEKYTHPLNELLREQIDKLAGDKLI